ncbi:MAG TPA: glycosyltransferase family A protein [Candidatus Binatia bacterium]
MSNKPLVSVVVIFFNGEAFLREAIESVFAQTYRHWELLLVDDGSIDQSRSIAERYVEQYPDKVRCLEHEGQQNRGMSASRNLGIENAKGEYIAFLDGDDVWLPPKLERQVSLLSAQPEVGMIYGAAQWWYSWTGKPEDRARDFVHPLGVMPDKCIEPPRLLLQFLMNEGTSPCIGTVMARRAVLERTGGFEEKFRGMYEDQAFCAKICLATRVFVSSECWHPYRQHAGSASAVAHKTGRHRAARLFFLSWLESYLTEHDIKDLAVWQTLEKELWRCQHPFLYRMKVRTRQLARVINAQLRGVIRTGDAR